MALIEGFNTWPTLFATELYILDGTDAAILVVVVVLLVPGVIFDSSSDMKNFPIKV